jgi:Fic family protein
MSTLPSRFTITNAITAGLTAIERARGFLEAATLSDEWVRRMSQRALLLEAHHTTHIEGTHLTIEQSERLWAGQPVAEAQADDVRELLNYREAFKLVSEYLESGEPVTEGLIREIHKRLVDGVRGGQGGPGAYRTVQNYVVNSRTREVMYTPPPPEDVPPLMRDLVAWLRAESAFIPCWLPASRSISSCTSTRFSTATGAPRACSRPCPSTAPATTSSACSL